MTRIEPEWALVTVAFVDLRGFTAFADRASARAAVDHLNAFFAVAVPAVERHGGRVNKLLGDGLLVVFDGPGHADAALAAATELVGDERFALGVGVNSGLVLMGTVGVGDVVEDAVIGDPVNVAARVQDATRALREPVLFTEATRCLLEADASCEPRGTLELRGKSTATPVYAVTLPGRLARRKEPA